MDRAGTWRLWLRPQLLGLHVFAAAATIFCLIGGSWQFGVYDTRQETERADRQEVPTVVLDEVWSPGQPFRDVMNHRPVTVTGSFAATDEQHWISGRESDGEQGYWLLTPLVLEDSPNDAILVVRGFSTEAGELPAPPTGTQEIRVILEPGEPVSDADTFATAEDNVLSSIRVPALVQELPYSLFPGYGISTTEAAAGGLVMPETPEQEISWMVGMRNLAYSLQWWAFAIFAVFMWWRMCRDYVANEQARRAAADSEPVDSLSS